MANSYFEGRKVDCLASYSDTFRKKMFFNPLYPRFSSHIVAVTWSRSNSGDRIAAVRGFGFGVRR